MTTEIKTWQIVNGQLEDVQTTLKDEGKTEAFDLETWIVSNPSIIGHNLTILGRQVQTRSGPLDILAVDGSGNLVIVELKRDMLPREALAQAIDYAADVADWGIEKISEICSKFSGKSLEESLSEAYPEEIFENININDSQKILLVGFSVESSLERMITWLSENFGLGINVIVLQYFVSRSGDELLTRTSLISEETVEERVQKKKFAIARSDEPGVYEEDDLRKLLIDYLSQQMVSVMRIKDVLIPACLEHPKVQRDLLKQKLVETGEKDDLTSAGLALTSISNQMGFKKNDFLRQVIGYSYPNNPWEKDDFFIREGYGEFMRGLLNEVNTIV